MLLEGACDPGRFIALVRDFIVFEDDGGPLVKKMAGYHQFHAVRVALGRDACAPPRYSRRKRSRNNVAGMSPDGRPGGKPGDRRIGVVWHTQGSGKSLSDGVLRRSHNPGAGDGQSYGRRSHRPQRPGRPALQQRSPGARSCCASRRSRRRAGPT